MGVLLVESEALGKRELYSASSISRSNVLSPYIGEVSRLSKLLLPRYGDSKYVEPGVLRLGKAVEDGADITDESLMTSCGETVPSFDFLVGTYDGGGAKDTFK